MCFAYRLSADSLTWSSIAESPDNRNGQEISAPWRRSRLRRARFPRAPEPEWYVVDLLKHHEMAGVSQAEVEERLVVALAGNSFDPDKLRRMARGFATSKTRELIERAIVGSSANQAKSFKSGGQSVRLPKEYHFEPVWSRELVELAGSAMDFPYPDEPPGAEPGPDLG